MFEDMVVAAMIAEVEREGGRWRWSLPRGPFTQRRRVPAYQPVVERPRPDATRILARWLAARRAGLGGGHGTQPARGCLGRAPVSCCCGDDRAA